MAKILFRRDLEQTNSINDLYSVKVNLSTYNSAINNINTDISTLRSDMETADDAIKTYADDLVQSLRDNEIKVNSDAIALLNAGSDTEGSVDYKIAGAITSIVNGAPEAYDTLKELLDLINNEEAGFQDLIDQLNAKVDAVVGAASEGWQTLEDIENTVKAATADLQSQIDDLSSSGETTLKSIPYYKYDNELSISSEDKVTLSMVPVGDIMGGRATVYSTDEDTGDITVEGIYTLHHDDDDTTGKTYIIDSDDDLSEYKASIEYFWRQLDNE